MYVLCIPLRIKGLLGLLKRRSQIVKEELEDTYKDKKVTDPDIKRNGYCIITS